ncbi:SpoVG family protein [Limnoglobus roseus]|uniref:Stage V sporulation protein G n=1 Tax=Limnoglobus roseus TaxID=2598579 RepID=A0A5C1A7G6_9BACT|nr:SpoVG family protein [Limnoglobus roseus]QEL15229.1 stage V sporulation protein G [Limnoglobus roseus]
MHITEVRIKLCEANHERLLAFCSITFNHAFVIRDLKVIDGTRGLFVAMPSRKLTDRCTSCSCKNHLRARFCNNCGRRLDEARAIRESEGRAKLHADIAHPIHSQAREDIQRAISKAYAEERERAKLPGYTCSYDDHDYDLDDVPMYSEMVKTPAGYKAHAPHAAATRGTHLTGGAMPAEKVKTDDGFGVGIV